MRASVALVFALFATGAVAQEQGPSTLSDDAIIQELHSCVMEAIRISDDGKEDTKIVAANAVTACDTETKAASKVASAGHDQAYYDKFYTTLKGGDYFIPLVTEERSIRKDVDASRAQFGEQAYNHAMDHFKAANDAGKTDEADHWAQVAVQLKTSAKK